MQRRMIVLLFSALMVSSGCMRSPEARSARFVEAGQKLLQKHDSARAVLQFRNAIRANPKNAEAYFQLGLAYLQSADYPGAVAAFRHALKLNPRHSEAQLRLAQVMASTSDPAVLQDAEQRLKALLRQSPENLDALHTLGLTELKLAQPADAMQHLERAMALAPRQLVYAVTLAQAKLQQKDVPGAEEVLKRAVANSPHSADALVLLGRFYASQNDMGKAEQEFQKALALDGKSAEALYNLALIQLHTGRKQQAERNLSQLARSSTKDLKPAYGLFLFQEGRREEAIREFERLWREDPEDRAARTRLVAAYQASNRTPDAQKILNQALQKNPKDVEALLQRGELELRTRDLAGAEADLNRVLHLRPDSAQVHYAAAKLYQARGTKLMYRQELYTVVRLNPLLLPVRLELAKALIADNGADAAQALLDGAPAAQRNLPEVVEQRNWALLGKGESAQAQKGVQAGLAVRKTPDLLLQDAVLKMQAKRYAEARQALQEALQMAPDDIRLLRALVRSYAAQKQVPAAVAAVQAHAARHPNSAQVQYFLGSLLLQTGQQAEATRAFTSAVALQPAYTPAELELARMNLTHANWTDARHQLTGLLASQGENPLARLWLGMLEESVGNHQAAIAAFRKVTQDQPSNAIACNNLAYLLAEYSQRADEALAYAQKAVELDPDNPDFQDTLGWVFYRKGLYGNAIAQLQEAVSKKSGARQEYHLAMAYFKAGQENRGRTLLQTALRKDPNLPEAQQAQALFQANAPGTAKP